MCNEMSNKSVCRSGEIPEICAIIMPEAQALRFGRATTGAASTVLDDEHSKAVAIATTSGEEGGRRRRTM